MNGIQILRQYAQKGLRAADDDAFANIVLNSKPGDVYDAGMDDGCVDLARRVLAAMKVSYVPGDDQ